MSGGREAWAAVVGSTVVEVSGLSEGSEVVRIVTDRGLLLFRHDEDCCETVLLEDFESGDLIGGMIWVAEVRYSNDDPEGYSAANEWRESFTWSFVTIRTTKGDLDMRWLGESNGYYSETPGIYWFAGRDE